MHRSIRIKPKAETGRGQSVMFVLAVGAARQVCRLKTTFGTQNQARSYLQKHRKTFELAARERTHECAALELLAACADLLLHQRLAEQSVRLALEALEREEFPAAADTYQGVLTRWAEVRSREIMN